MRLLVAALMILAHPARAEIWYSPELSARRLIAMCADDAGTENRAFCMGFLHAAKYAERFALVGDITDNAKTQKCDNGIPDTEDIRLNVIKRPNPVAWADASMLARVVLIEKYYGCLWLLKLSK